jgi:hypothetical protein
VHLVGFTIEIYYDARLYKRQILANFVSEDFNTLKDGCNRILVIHTELTYHSVMYVAIWMLNKLQYFYM